MPSSAGEHGINAEEQTLPLLAHARSAASDGERLSDDADSDAGDEVDDLIEESERLLVASDAAVDHSLVEDDEPETSARRKPLGRRSDASQRDERDEDGEWTPTQLPKLLAETSNATLERFHANKWREIHQLFLLLQAPSFRGVRLAGNDRALFETFSRAFLHDSVTKARFGSVLRSALGIRRDQSDRSGAKPRSHRDDSDQQQQQQQECTDHLALSRHLDRLKYCCERGGDNVPMLHWRTLLIALRMFQEPLLPMREHLAWAFSVFASVNGYLELKPLREHHERGGGGGGSVAVGDLFLLFTHALRSPAAAAFVSDRLRAALAMAPPLPPPPTTTTTTTTDVSRQMRRLLGPSASRVSRAEFLSLLRLPPLRSLLRHGAAATTTDACWPMETAPRRRLTSVHTCALDELCSAVYRAHVVRARRREHHVRAVQRLRCYHSLRAARACFSRWAALAARQVRARQRLAAADAAIASRRQRRAWRRLQAFCMASIAAVELQRVFRGFRGRRAWLAQWTRVQAALRVQGAFRMRAHLSRLARALRRRSAMAVRVQRVFRGRRGRVAARQALLETYQREMQALRAERQAWYAHVRAEMAARIQRAARRLLRERLARRRREQAAAEQAAEQAARESAEQAQRAVRRHRAAVAAEYERLRVEHERREARRAVDALEKRKLERRRRQRAWDALRAERLARRERLLQRAAEAHAALEREWRGRIDERASARRALAARLLALDDADAAPLEREWRALRGALQQRVQQRRRELAAKLQAARAAVSKHEVEQQAREEAAEMEAEAARQTATSEWLEAQAAFLRRLDDESEQRDSEEAAQQRAARERSAVRVQSAFRMFAARKQLRDAVRARVVKRFDAAARRPVYRNTLTGEESAQKPRALGSEELPFSDEWLVLRDEAPAAGAAAFFFYHPHSMRQSWELPADCRLCARCASEAAAPAFAAFWDATAALFVCRACAEEQQGGQGSPGDRLVPYDGSRGDGGAAGR